MSVYKRLLVLGMCAAVLASPLQASASDISVGGALIVDGHNTDSKATDEDRETARGAIEDYCSLKKDGIADKSITEKLDAICRKYSDKVAGIKTVSGLNELVKSAKGQMSAALTGSSSDSSSDQKEDPAPLSSYSAEDAKRDIEAHEALVLQDCYDHDAVKEIVKYAEEDIDNNAKNWSADNLQAFVTKTKERMDKYDMANAPVEEKEPDLPAPTDYVQVGGNWVTPVATYGQRVNVVLPIVNMAKETAYDVIVTPLLDTDPEVWPFDIEQSSYTVKLDALAGENVNGDAMARRQEITWNFKTRKDVTSGYKKIGFNVQYTNSAGEQVNTTLNTYVKAVGAPGSGKGDSTSTPRLIVTGFETNPAEVKAGDAFNLVIHMKNTSKRTAISNVEFTLKAAAEGKDEDAVYEAFLPVAGSSTIYVESIPADGTTDISIDLKSKADLAQKPYVLNINMKYEDENLKEFTADSSVSIPVHQDARFEVSEPEVMPSAIEVGSESNIMFSIYNTGKTTLYNVSVRFEGDSISGGDAFVGNIQPGGTGQVDTMITGMAPTMDEGMIKAIISYEDNETNKTEVEKEISLFVSEPYYPEDMDMGMDMMEEEPKGMPAWAIVLIVLAVIAAGAAAAVIVRKKKKARAQSLLESELADSIGDESKDEKGE
ncbi:MAG: hypothetical protein SPF84_09620 [Lachnospiraceae bacterium]|nr:hypothetical protein [Lachnospiraceae bacterium]